MRNAYRPAGRFSIQAETFSAPPRLPPSPPSPPPTNPPPPEIAGGSWGEPRSLSFVWGGGPDNPTVNPNKSPQTKA